MAKYRYWIVPLFMFVSLSAYGSGDKLVGTWELDLDATQKMMAQQASTMPDEVKQQANVEAIGKQLKTSGMSGKMEWRADGTGRRITRMRGGQKTVEKFQWRVLKEEDGKLTVEMVSTVRKKDARQGAKKKANAAQAEFKKLKDQIRKAARGQAKEEEKVTTRVPITLTDEETLHFDNSPMVWKRTHKM